QEDAGADAAAGHAQPHRAGPHRFCRRGPLSAASLRRLRDGGLSAARCLPALPLPATSLSGCRQWRDAPRGDNDPHLDRCLFSRADAVALDCGPSVVAHLHGDLREGERVRLQFKLDKSGQAIAMALPTADTPNMADDPQWRELTSDPKYRRVLITDGRTAVGQALARSLSEAAASVVFVGIADPWKPFPGEECLRKIERVEIVALDLTDTTSVN